MKLSVFQIQDVLWVLNNFELSWNALQIMCILMFIYIFSIDGHTVDN